ncbi:MAG: DNA-directed RNA polymerase subunit beta' [Planctomycetota bacterium]|nr:MAG: DNA-directed RNA polymerase subunit beta' [Planctomycetota bacterium]
MSVAETTTTFDRVNDYRAVRISLASPHDIRSWSYGEVKKPETINYRTYRPERDGLFCERIFGPEKDWECSCGKYRGMKYKGMICDRCGVKVTHSRVRRKRMGHIELAAPVVHIWFFKSAPSRLGALLDMKVTDLEKVIYFQDYVVLDPKGSDFKQCDLLTEDEYREAQRKYGPDAPEVGMGAEAIKRLLMSLDLNQLSHDLRAELQTVRAQQKQRDLIKRLKVVEALRDSENRPEWMVLDVIPVIPPDLRPLVQLESGNFATSDLNDLYRRIINRNNRLKKLVDLNAPEVIIRNEKRMLQQSVDALFDNSRCKRPVVGTSNRPLKSLTDMIKGKQGRFRENLLGKRVDYSARSVIVVGPELLLHQCGLPKKIALELFQPFIIRRLKELGHADTIKSAKRMLERKDEEVWDILDEVIQNHPVLLNRAPTLHRMGIQAFEPVLVEGNAIRIHPLVCKGFNADFDGDQMAVHLPLSIEAQVEATTLMMSTNNIFSPANGSPIISPSQDIVMGCYYLTIARDGRLGEGMVFSSPAEVHTAFQHGKVVRHTRIKVRLPKSKRVVGEGEEEYKPGGILETTVGRVLFNDILDERMAFYNMEMGSKQLARVISDCYLELGRRATIDLLDRMKAIGFQESTNSGLSFGLSDLVPAPNKQQVIAEAEKAVLDYQRRYERGFITDKERKHKVLDIWTRASDEIKDALMKTLEHDVRDGAYVNPIFLMANSGARGGVEQIRQLGGMRGLMSKPSGEIIETPIKANFREGLSVLEYFSSTHGARKGLADTALKTADSGYLTRKLADVCQNVVITMHDCGTTKGVRKGAVRRGESTEVSFVEAIRGRVSRVSVVDPVTDEVLVRENELITHEIAERIAQLGIETLQVRSPMTCEAPLGVCRLCYGMDLSTGDLVEEGLAVGIIAAQSIGEPGTQLTMRTFHIGGTASRQLEESEIRCKRSGTVRFVGLEAVEDEGGHLVALKRGGEIAIVDAKGRHLEKYLVPVGAEVLVREGQSVERDTVMARWDPHTLPVLARVGGRVRFEDLIEGKTFRAEQDKLTGSSRYTVLEYKGDLHPQIIIEDERGELLDFHYIPAGATIEVEPGQEIRAGTVLAKTTREARGTGDITGGLPRVTELFEARRPKEPAVISEIDGVVDLPRERKRGKRLIIVRAEDGTEVEHPIPHGKQLIVHKGDVVKAGEPLVYGPLVPDDILRISGVEELQQYLLNEIQAVYREQNVSIDDKHIEIVIAQMLRKVRVTDVGDTKLLPRVVVDKRELARVNQELTRMVKIISPGDTEWEPGELVPRETVEEVNEELKAEGKEPATFKNPRPARATQQLLGITKAAVQSESFISAASFQETTRVLTEAALASKVDRLVGLKENVILGHLIPAGTGFHEHVNAEVRIHPEALRQLQEEKQRILDQRRSLLADVQPDSEPGVPPATQTP